MSRGAALRVSAFAPAQPRGCAVLAVLLVLCLVFGTTAHSQLPSFSVSSSTPSSPFRCLSSTCSFITLPHFLSLYCITSSISPPLPSPLLSFSFPHAPPRLVPGIDPCPRPPPYRLTLPGISDHWVSSYRQSQSGGSLVSTSSPDESLKLALLSKLSSTFHRPSRTLADSPPARPRIVLPREYPAYVVRRGLGLYLPVPEPG